MNMSLEPGNIGLIIIFALLLFFVSCTGILVYSVCGREPVVTQPRSWASLFSMLILTLLRVEQTAAARRPTDFAMDMPHTQHDVDCPGHIATCSGLSHYPQSLVRLPRPEVVAEEDEEDEHDVENPDDYAQGSRQGFYGEEIII